MSKPSLLPVLIALFAMLLVGLDGPALAEEVRRVPDIAPSDSGAYMKDHKTQLVWPRCAEGMEWKGLACTGTPLLLDRAEAIALAASRKQSDGLNWRLPTVAELTGLVKNSPGIKGLDEEAFPPVALEWFWSSTTVVTAAPAASNQYNYSQIAQGGSSRNDAARVDLPRGWAVSLVTGESRPDVPSRTKLPVRLVLSTR